MASKKRYVFEKKFQQGKKFGGAGASSSCAAFEKEWHFCVVIPKGRSYCHLQIRGIKRGTARRFAVLKGYNKGHSQNLSASFRKANHHFRKETEFENASFKWEGHYHSDELVFTYPMEDHNCCKSIITMPAVCLMLKWNHLKGYVIEHQSVRLSFSIINPGGLLPKRNHIKISF